MRKLKKSNSINLCLYKISRNLQSSLYNNIKRSRFQKKNISIKNTTLLPCLAKRKDDHDLFVYTLLYMYFFLCFISQTTKIFFEYQTIDINKHHTVIPKASLYCFSLNMEVLLLKLCTNSNLL